MKETHSLTDLLHGLVGPEAFVPPVVISGLAEHSSVVQKGDLYLAMAGHRVHGLDFLASAVAHGARAIAWEPDKRYQSLDCATPAVRIVDLRHCAGIIADRFFSHPSAEMTVVAITGTNGKTSTAHLVSEMFSQIFSGCGLIGTLGSGTVGRLEKTTNTTPAALLLHQQMRCLADQDIRHVVMEASSHGLSQGRLAGIQVDTAVFTSLGRDHFDYHGSAAAYRAAKKLLFETSGLRHAVINADDAFGRELIEFCRHRIRLITYSTHGHDADVSACNIASSRSGLSFQLRHGDFETLIESSLLGRFNVANLVAAFSVLLAHGIDAATAVSLMRELRAIKGRMQSFVGTATAPLVILDYAHTPEALHNALQTCAEITRGNIYCVFGCGGNRDQGKRQLMGKVASRLAHHVVLTDDNPRAEVPEKIVADILQGAKKHLSQIVVEHDRREAIRSTIAKAQRDDCVLIAGKGHETEQIVQGQMLHMDDGQIIAAALAGTD